VSRAQKSDRERGPVGTWARSQRLEHGYRTSEEAVEALHKLTGYKMRADYLRGIESGNQRPGPETLKALETLYQVRAPEHKGQNIDELVEKLIVALNGHAESNWSLARELAPLAALGARVVGAEGAAVLAELANVQPSEEEPSGSPRPRRLRSGRG